MPLFPIPAVLLQSMPQVTSMPTGLEWMPIASIVVPALLIIFLVYYGRKTTV